MADMVMQRIVDPPYAGSNPASHLTIILYIAASHYAEPLILCPEGGIIMPKNTTITLTPEELKLLLDAMEDEEFIMSIPLLLEDLNKEELDAEKEDF